METQLLFDFAKEELYDPYQHRQYLRSKHSLNPEEAETYCRRLGILLQHAKFSHAHALIDEAEIKITKNTPLYRSGSILDKPLADSELSARYVNVLENAGFITWGDVANYKPSWFIEHIVNFGPAGVKALQTAFKRIIKEYTY